MKNASLCALVGVLVAGCGGGDGGSSTRSATTSSPPPPPVAQQLSQYIGTWTSGCDHHTVDTIVVTRTPGTTDSIDIAAKTDYFSADDCTGPVAATATNSANITSKFVATIDSSVEFTSSSGGVISKIDQVTTSLPQITSEYTGSGIYRTVEYGIPAVCVDFGNGSAVCRTGEIMPAQPDITEGLLVQGDIFYVASPSGTGYTVEQKYTKKTN